MLSTSGRLAAPTTLLRRACTSSSSFGAFSSSSILGRSATPVPYIFGSWSIGSRSLVSWTASAPSKLPPVPSSSSTRQTSSLSSLIVGGSKTTNPLVLSAPSSLSLLGLPGLLGAVRGVKTNRAAAKRIRVMGSGGLKRSRAGRSHNTGYLTRKRKNHLARGTGIKGKGHEKRMRRLINAL